MAPNDLDPTLLKMQERIAWLEGALQENNQLLEDMAQRLDKVERQIKVLAQPHYADAEQQPALS